MGLFTWTWIYEIAPVETIEKHEINSKSKIFRKMGGFQTRKIYSGLKLPSAGEMVKIPDYGVAKVERVNFVNGYKSRAFTVTIVISPKSLGNSKWWKENRNNPIVEYSQNWKLNTTFMRGDYIDLEIPEDTYVDDDYFS